MELQSQNQYSLAFTYICIIFSKCKSIVPIFPEQFKTVSIFICVQLKLIVVVVGAASISVLVILHSLLFVLNRIGSLHCIYIYIAAHNNVSYRNCIYAIEWRDIAII